MKYQRLKQKKYKTNFEWRKKKSLNAIRNRQKHTPIHIYLETGFLLKKKYIHTYKHKYITTIIQGILFLRIIKKEQNKTCKTKHQKNSLLYNWLLWNGNPKKVMNKSKSQYLSTQNNFTK